MSFPRERGSQDCLRSSQFCNDSTLGDIWRLSARDGEDELQRRSLHQIELDSMEPFDFEELAFKDRSSLFNGVMTNLQFWKRPKKHSLVAHRSPRNFKASLARTLRRRPRISKCILYIIFAYLSILLVSL